MLIAALTHFLSGENKKADAKEYLQQPAKESQNLAAQPRLVLRQRDSDFFRKYIQDLEFGKLNSLAIDYHCKNDAQKNIVRNARVLLDCIQNEFHGNNADVFDFLKFLVQKCCLVVVSTPSQNRHSVFSLS